MPFSLLSDRTCVTYSCLRLWFKNLGLSVEREIYVSEFDTTRGKDCLHGCVLRTFSFLAFSTLAKYLAKSAYSSGCKFVK